MKLQNNNGQYRITIPKNLISLLRWKHGTELSFILDKTNNFVIKKVKKGIRLQNNNNQFRVTIPKDLVKLLRWKHGTELAFILDKSGKLIIKEIKK